MASNSQPNTSQALPGLPVVIKQEPEEFKNTPALFEDDGLDDEFYGHNEEVQRALKGPEEGASSYIADDDDLAFAGHNVEEPEFRGPAKGQAVALTMRPATSMRAAPIPAPQMRRATMPKPKPALMYQHMTPGTNLPLDNPSFAVMPISRVRQPDGSPFPTMCFEQELLHEPLAHRLLCGHLTLTSSSLPCGSTCRSSNYASGMPDGEDVSCHVYGCRYKIEVPVAPIASVFDPMPEDFRRGPREIDPNRRVLDADGEEAGTVCWQELRRAPYSHMLMCGHEIQTKDPEACHANCQPLTKKAAEKKKFSCRVQKCHEKEVRLSKVLRPTTNARVTKPKQPAKKRRGVDRELDLLRVMGKAKLGYGQATQERRDVGNDARSLRQATPFFNNMDLVAGQRLEFPKERPHSMSEARNGGFFSMPEGEYHAMREDEGGVQVEIEANSFGRRALHLEGRFDMEDRMEQVEDDEAAATTFDVADKHCVCESAADGYMVACVRCDLYFHPCCIGKGQHSPEEYESEKRYRLMQTDADLFRLSEEFTCADCDTKAEQARTLLGTEGRRAYRGEARKARKANIDMLDKIHGPGKAQAAPRQFIDWILFKCDTVIDEVQSLRNRAAKGSSAVSCGRCGQTIQGLFFHCLSAHCRSWHCCDGCAINGAAHEDGAHRFEAMHTSDLDGLSADHHAEGAPFEEKGHSLNLTKGKAAVGRRPQKRTRAVEKASADQDVEMGGVDEQNVMEE
ncbi:hypothetical protein LTR97_000592 [Elasticomyces elasticus]|uniref:Zinc finger PHD-type domain-containing protein n=1 Tax=Elasticomyces elasticus TaxID=574655 RepID=A0AAN7VXK7_9PEZI|nr:hypothetical protein LTR97_000592 [Elasticomyces elasticus]